MGVTRPIVVLAIIATCFHGFVYAGRFRAPAAPQPAQAPGAPPAASAAAMPDEIGDRAGFPSGSPAPGARPTRQTSTPRECARDCVRGEPPKTCYYHFTVEYYSTLSNACKFCTPNGTMRFEPDCQCITGDGYELSGIIVVNRMYPGPPIVVCENDMVIVDVENKVAGNAISLHWHGITQRNSQYYDGVPQVTQCPIQEGMTFRYKWQAANSGSHFWHAHTGLHKAMGLEGALIVREPRTSEINFILWDEEHVDHTLFISDWFHDQISDHLPGTIVRRPNQLPDNFLINGLGRWTDPETGRTTTTPRAVYIVKPGKRYRFRMINSCTMACPVTLTIEAHTLLVFSSDGEPFSPVEVTSITSSSAERYDFVLTTKPNVSGDFWIQVRGIGGCQNQQMHQLAILRYVSNHRTRATTREPTYGLGLTRGVVLNELNVRCDNKTQAKDVVCITQLKSIEPVPEPTLRRTPDFQILMPFGFFRYTEENIFQNGTYKRFLVNGGNQFASLVSNISNSFPPFPLIHQREDNPKGQICNPNNLPERCATSSPCSCSHVLDIPLYSVVELILVDEVQSAGLSHPFHLHGMAFHILGDGCGDDYNISSINIDIVRDMDRRGMLKRQFDRPPAKDTFALPNNGFSIIRFITDNPGYWLFHCHFLPHLYDGMSMVFHVGTPRDLPPVPKNFPKCGNFLPAF